MARDESPKRKGGKEIIRHFAPAWFAVIMGTGAVSLLFNSFPYGHGVLPMTIFTFFFFFLNLALFILFTAISIARYIMFPDIWTIMVHHPVQSMYLGCFPMGGATLLNLALGLLHQQYDFGGKTFLYALWGFWWLDVAVSILSCFGILHIMYTSQSHALERMTTVWLLPVVPLIVAASSGGLFSLALLDEQLKAFLTVTVSAFMVVIGLSLAFMMLTVYLFRLIIYGLPQGATVLSVFLPIGPMGQGGFAIILIGRTFKALLPIKGSSPDDLMGSQFSGDAISVLCVCIAFTLWALATMWLVFALWGLQHVLRRTQIPFKVTFWGLIFPNGVYANLTIALATTFHSRFFRAYGAAYSVATLILWVGVFIPTVRFVRAGEIFEAPCLEDLDMAKMVGSGRKSEDRANCNRATACPREIQTLHPRT